MQTRSNTSRLWRNDNSCPAAVIDRRREHELLAIPSIRAVARRARLTPAVAAVVAELCGLSKEAAHA